MSDLTTHNPRTTPLPKIPTQEEARRAFGDAVREAMRVEKMTQVDLAEAVGVSQGTVSGWVAGVAPASEMVFAVERTLKLKPGSLSRHLGYLPAEAFRTPSDVRASIMEDPGLTTAEKTMMLAAYEAAVAGRPRKRRKP